MMDIEIHSPNYVILDGFQNLTFLQLNSVLVDYLPVNGVVEASVIIRILSDLVLRFSGCEVVYAK